MEEQIKEAKELRLLEKKYQIASSEEYKELKRLQLEEILNLSLTGIDPMLLKGMLIGIKNTDSWVRDFEVTRKIK